MNEQRMLNEDRVIMTCPKCDHKVAGLGRGVSVYCPYCAMIAYLNGPRRKEGTAVYATGADWEKVWRDNILEIQRMFFTLLDSAGYPDDMTLFRKATKAMQGINKAVWYPGGWMH